MNVRLVRVLLALVLSVVVACEEEGGERVADAGDPPDGTALAPDAAASTAAPASDASHTPPASDASQVVPASDASPLGPASDAAPPNDAGPPTSARDAAVDQPDASAHSDASTPDASSNCPDGFSRGSAGTMVREIATTMPTIDGLAVCPDGNVFVTVPSVGEVWRIPLDGGAPELWSATPEHFLSGLTCDRQGRLFAASYREFLGSREPVMLLIEQHGQKVTLLSKPPLIAQPLVTLYDVLAVDGVGVYATDPDLGLVILQRETAPGSFEASVVLYEAMGANGMAHGADGRLYIALRNNFGVGEVASFAVAADGTLGDRKQAVKTPQIIEDVALDEQGSMYGTVVAADRTFGSVMNWPGTILSSRGLPANLAFRGGTLLYTDFDFGGAQADRNVEGSHTTGHLYAIDLGRCGAR